MPETLTVEQLQAQLEEQRKENEKKIAELVAKHNSEMANLRVKNKEDVESAVKKATEEAKLSAEELSKKRTDEELALKDKKIKEYESQLQTLNIEKALNDNNLPSFLKNDQRLINSTKETLVDVVKVVKEEYLKSTMESAKSTNVATNTTQKTKEDTFKEFQKMM